MFRHRTGSVIEELQLVNNDVSTLLVGCSQYTPPKK